MGSILAFSETVSLRESVRVVGVSCSKMMESTTCNDSSGCVQGLSSEMGDIFLPLRRRGRSDGARERAISTFMAKDYTLEVFSSGPSSFILIDVVVVFL